MPAATKSKPKSKAAPNPEPTPTTAAELRNAIAVAEKKLGGMSPWDSKYDALEADIRRMQADLALAEVREMPPPAAVTTDFHEQDISLATIVVTGNHREQHDQAALERLAASLKTQKLQQRIGVRAMGDGRFELIFGSRRCAAAKLARWEDIPAKVYAEGLTPAQVEILRSIENFGRENLSAVEEAVAIARTIEAIEQTLDVMAREDGDPIWQRPIDPGTLSSPHNFSSGFEGYWAKNPDKLAAYKLAQEIHAAGSLEAYVGQQFSRSAKWVKDHAYVSKLGGKARHLLMAGRIDIGHARELAKLGDRDKADQIAGWAARDESGLGGKDVEFVRKSVHESLRSLRTVPWQLTVAFGQGEPGCTGHACVTCPFNSKTDPDLFGGSITDEPEAGVCTNETCFKAKGEIIDKEMARVAKKAAPVAKKAGAITQTTVGALIPLMVKPTSAVRRLQKDLAKVVAPEASSSSAAPAVPGKAKATAEEAAKQKLEAALRQWGKTVREAFWEKVYEDGQGYRALSVVALDFSDLTDALDAMPHNATAGDVETLLQKHSEKITAAINAREGLPQLVVQLLKAKNLEDRVFTYLGNMHTTALFGKVAAGWGAKLPPEPKLEDFLPKPKPAKVAKSEKPAVLPPKPEAGAA